MNLFNAPRFPLIAFFRFPLFAAMLGWLSMASAQIVPSATQHRPMTADDQAHKSGSDSPYKPIPLKKLQGLDNQVPAGAVAAREGLFYQPARRDESTESQRALNRLMTAHTDAIKTLVNQVDDLQARVLQLEAKIRATGVK